MHMVTDRLTFLADRIEVGEDCWNWTGYIQNNGYGAFRPTMRDLVLAHRAVYEATVEEITPGLELDHLCFNKRCVNPDHLEPVTHRENIRRAFARITECPHGHPYTPDNLAKDKLGHRKCAECIRQRQRAAYRRKRDVLSGVASRAHAATP